MSTTTTRSPRIDSLTPGTFLELDLNGSVEQAMFVRITGEGRATFVQCAWVGNVTEEPYTYEWDAYRYNGHWAYGSGADRLYVERILATPDNTAQVTL